MRKLILFLFAITMFLVPLVSSLTLTSETVLNTTLSNSSMTFSINVTVDEAEINESYILLKNVTFSSYGKDYNFTQVLWNKPNTNIDSSRFYNLDFIWGGVLHYKLNENTGTTAYDSSCTDTNRANCNDGTISGATWSSEGTQTLVENVDYSLASNGVFTLLNPVYSYSLLNLSWNYIDSELNQDRVLARQSASGLAEYGNWFTILAIIGIVGLVFYLLFTMVGRGQGFSGGTY